MAVAGTITDHWSDTKRIHIVMTLVFSSNYVSGGETPVVANLSDLKSDSNPVVGIILGQTSYVYRFTSAGKVKIFDYATGAELSAAPYPVGVTGDTVNAYLIFPKFV